MSIVAIAAIDKTIAPVNILSGKGGENTTEKIYARSAERGRQMDQLIKGKMKSGKFYVRPINWAGIWSGSFAESTELISGNTLFETETEAECDIFIEEYNNTTTYDFDGIKSCITRNSELKQLISENPDLPILFMCGEECYNDDFGYTVNTGAFWIEEVTLVDDMICDDKTELEERIFDKLDRKYPHASKDFLEKLTNSLIKKYVWQSVIAVRLG